MSSLRESFRALFRSKAEKPADKKVDTSIVSVETSWYGGRSSAGSRQRYNPDELVSRQGLRIYSQMRNDEQVKAVCIFKRDTILSRGWSFKLDEDSKLSQSEKLNRIAIFNKLVDRMQGSFADGLNMISLGREYGYSLTEKVYAPVEIDGKTWVGLRKLVARDPSTFEFNTDPYGDLISCEQVAGGQKIDIDLDRFVYYVHNPEFDPYFGRSDLRSAYRSWYFKNEMVKLWAMYLEKFGGGFLVGKLAGENAPRFGTPAYAALQEVVANAKASGSILLPQGVELEAIFPQGGDVFEAACTWHDLAIARALLVPNLLGVSHTGQTGAYSQSQTQIESFAWTVRADAQRLEAVLNEQLFRDLGERNWGDGEYPRFAFNPISQEYMRWFITTWQSLVASKVVIQTEEDEARLREMLEMPVRKPGSKPLFDEAEPEPVGGQQATAADAEGDEDECAGKEDAKDNPRVSDKKKLVRVSHTHDGKPRSCTPAAFTRAVQRVAFAQIERRGEFDTSRLRDEMAGMVARVTKRLLGGENEMAKLLDSDVSDIAAIEFSGSEKGKLKEIARRALGIAYLESSNIARMELERATKQRFSRKTFADIRDKAQDFFEVNGFRMAGNVSDAVRAIIQLELQNGVKYGRSVTEVRTSIWNRLVERGLTSAQAARGEETDEAVLSALDDLWVDTEEQAAAYLDTLARTNLFEAINEARFAEFNDPSLQGFVVAFEYSSVLDDRTTVICEYMDSRVYAANSPVWDEYRPPNHYNCRSLLVPITKIDVEDGVWDGIEDGYPSVEPQAGFK